MTGPSGTTGTSGTWIVFALVLVPCALAALPGAEPAAITGRIVDAASGKPLANAAVTLATADAPVIRGLATVQSDADGRFELKNLQAGDFILTASKDGYAPGAYGALASGALHQVLDLADGEQADVAVRLYKEAVVTGTVTDEVGDPVVWEFVRLLGRVAPDGMSPRWYTLASARTDDRGIYRFPRVPPGRYVVGLQGQSQPGAESPAAFHPSSVSISSAATLTIGAGEVREHVDVRKARGPTARVSGLVLGLDLRGAQGRGANGRPAVILRLAAADAPETPAGFEVATATSERGGRFTFPRVPGGRYLIRVMDLPPSPLPGAELGSSLPVGALRFAERGFTPAVSDPTLWAAVPVTVGDRDLDGITVALRAGARIHGRVVFDGAIGTPSEQTVAAIALAAFAADYQEAGYFAFGRITPDGQFTTRSLAPGRYAIGPLPTGYGLRLGSVPATTQAWHLMSVRVAGREQPGGTINLGSEDVTDVLITLTSRATELSGAVHGPDGTLVPDALVYVFPADPTLWRDNDVISRRFAELRPSRKGRYRTWNLAPGESFAVATTATPPEWWRVPEFLDLLSKTAIRITIAPGDRRELNLVVK